MPMHLTSVVGGEGQAKAMSSCCIVPMHMLNYRNEDVQAEQIFFFGSQTVR